MRTGDGQWEISRGPIILMSPCYCGLNCEPQKDIFKSAPLKVFVTMIVFGERVFADVISYMGRLNTVTGVSPTKKDMWTQRHRLGRRPGDNEGRDLSMTP